MDVTSSHSFNFDPPLLPATGLEAGEGTTFTVVQHDTNRSRGLKHWIHKNSFTPGWLPDPLRRPLFGYVIAALAELAAVVATLLLTIVAPAFGFHGIFVLAVLVLIVVGWGAGPGIFASLIGVLLLWLIVLPPHFYWKIPDLANGLALSLLITIPISLIVGESVRARQQAEETARHLAQVEAYSRFDAERLRAVLEVLPSGVLITNQEGRLQAMNRAARTFWGGEIPVGTDIRQLPEGKLWWAKSGKLVTPEEMPLVRVLGSGKPVLREELEMEVQDGQRKAILYSVAPMPDETGTIAGAIISAQDISELRSVEREADERAQELEAIFDTITDGIALLDEHGKLVRTNQAFRRLLGFEQHPEYLTLPHEQRIAAFTIRDAKGRPQLVGQWRDTAPLEDTAFTGVDLVIENLDKREVVVNVDGVSLRDRLGEVTGYIEMFRDVTARHHLEQQTRETLGTLVAMAEAMVQIRPPAPDVDPVGAAAIPYSADTALSLVARRLAELTRSVLGCRQVSLASVDPVSGELSPIIQVGLSAEQASAWWGSWSPPQRLEQRYGPAIAAALSAGEPVVLDARNLPQRPADPRWGAHRGCLVPMRLGQELVGVLLVEYADPEPDPARADERLLTTLAQLGALILERDRLLRGWAEARANALALAETKAQMETFLGIASHELKTPLTSLKLSLQLAQRRLVRLLPDPQLADVAGPEPEHPEPDRTRPRPDALLQAAVEQLSRTADQMARLEALVSDLVDVSRIQAGQLELRLAPTDLVALVTDMVEVQREATPDRTIRLHLSPTPVGTVRADGGRIEQVLTNFLTNALKYSSADQPVDVGIEAEPEQAMGRPAGVRVWVRDQGPGLSPTDQTHIWERFHRVQGVEVQSGTGVGLGLGLYICRMIVERHHGQVGVHSAPGQGATFWFTLPLSHSS